jgi:adenylate kinase
MNKSLLPKNYVLLGPPGSGKSTQATRLRETLGLTHIDIGSELRRLAESDTELGKCIHEVINVKKELVSDGLIGKVIEHVLKDVSSEMGVLIDGAPRRASQIDEVEEALKKHQREIRSVIFLDLSLEEAIKRISNRFLCLLCKTPVIKFDTAVESCSLCGGTVGQRQDDTKEGVTKRYEVFMAETRPVIDFFEQKGVLIRVDASLRPEEISEILIEKMQ